MQSQSFYCWRRNLTLIFKASEAVDPHHVKIIFPIEALYRICFGFYLIQTIYESKECKFSYSLLHEISNLSLPLLSDHASKFCLHVGLLYSSLLQSADFPFIIFQSIVQCIQEEINQFDFKWPCAESTCSWSFLNCNESQFLFEAGLIWLIEAPSLWVAQKDNCES